MVYTRFVEIRTITSVLQFVFPHKAGSCLSEHKNPTSRLESVDRVVRSECFKPIVEHWGFGNAVDAVRALQDDIRTEKDHSNRPTNLNEYAELATTWLGVNRMAGYQPVFNLTGTILHTNLGRAVLNDDLLSRAISTVKKPLTLEYDLRTGKRGEREGVIRERLVRLTNAESATVVNNNAAAVLIVLNSLALGRDVLVSRGELIEIGGSFRLPEILSRAGCNLVEVGTTNRTRIEDYANAITDQTAVLLKVHPSNFTIQGFTESASEQQLARLSRQQNIPFVLDLGSGALIDLQKLGIPREPLPQDSLSNGVDLVTFSGDKLLGGPQAGILVGKTEFIDSVNRNPLKRALRMDKLSLAVLDETLKAYEDGTTIDSNIQLVRDLKVSSKQLWKRAKQVEALLKDFLSPTNVDVVECHSVLGSGSQPDTRLPSVAVAISHERESILNQIEARLRGLNPPILGRRSKSQLLLDMRGAQPLEELLSTLHQLA